MKKLNYLTAAASAVLALTFASSVYSQADSGSVPPLRGTPRILPLSMQERETPVVNNTTQVTQNVTQQVTQTIQPDTYIASGGGNGYNAAAASADCGGGGVMLSGGGSCENGVGLVAVAASQPNGNGWYLSCGAGFQNGTVFATAYAVCSRR